MKTAIIYARAKAPDNFSDHYDNYKITSETTEEVIKQSEKAAFPLLNSSYKFPLSAPTKRGKQ